MQNNVNAKLKKDEIQRSSIESQQDEKEDDLVLAAKLGQTLLERNEELTSENNILLKKIEALRQENFVLRRDLQVVEDCNNSFIDDLKSEMFSLQESLLNQGMKQRAIVWKNSILERELRDQNQRLSQQLVEAGEREAELRRAKQSLRENVNRERSNLEDHFTYIDSLKGEISLTLDNKAELEKHASELAKEKESLSDSLDYSVGKIFSLEKRQRDQENLLRSSERELVELKASNEFLLEKLETYFFSRSSSQSCNTSILSELELFASDNEMSPHRRTSFATIHEEDEDIKEYDDDTLVVETESYQLKEEVMIACRRLQNLCKKIKGSSSENDDILTRDFQNYQLKSLTEELERLICENIPISTKQVSISCQTTMKNNQHEQDLNIELEKKRREVEGLVIRSKEAEVEITKKNMIIEGISEKLAVLQSRLYHVKIQRKNSEASFHSKIAEYENKFKKLEGERLQNEKEAETPPIASPTTSESMLCKKLQQFEDQLKEILGNSVICKKQTVNIPNIKKIDTDKIVEKDLGTKPLARR